MASGRAAPAPAPASMVSPSTKWLPISRIACRVAARTAGTPSRLASRPMMPCGRFAGLDDARRHAERPGRGVDEEGAGFGLVMDEIALAELVLDELVGGARHPARAAALRPAPSAPGPPWWRARIRAACPRRRRAGRHWRGSPRSARVARAVDPRLLRPGSARRRRAAGRRWRRRRRHRAREGGQGGHRAAWRVLGWMPKSSALSRSSMDKFARLP